MEGVTQTCSECQFDPCAVGAEELGPELLRLAAGYERLIADASAEECLSLSSRPSADVWSILEYVGHVEFIYDFVVTMCDAASSDELASVNGVDPDQHVDESRFNEIEAAEMSSRIRSAGERARAALDRLDSVALDRILEFNGNPAPLRLLTVAMLHESHHHLRDVRRLAAD